jgi:DNA/RNA endonuclease YhcR with UshA esterase domain
MPVIMASLLVLLNFLLLNQPPTIAPAAAKDHIGKEATVCGTVKSARYASTSNRKPTFLNLDKAFPNQIFTAVIFEENRSKFAKPPEEQFKDKAICVTGKIEEYNGTPEIVVTEPKQIEEKK